jgi:hypothetical protein
MMNLHVRCGDIALPLRLGTLQFARIERGAGLAAPDQFIEQMLGHRLGDARRPLGRICGMRRHFIGACQFRVGHVESTPEVRARGRHRRERPLRGAGAQ